MTLLVSSILKKKSGAIMSSDFVSEVVNLKIPNAHSIIFGVMVVVMKKFLK